MSDLTASLATPENTTSTEAPATAAPVKHLSELEQVDALLSGKPIQPETAQAPTPGGDADVAQEGDDDQAPETDDQGGDDASQIDYAKEIPLNNGEKMTVGALKDFYQGYDAKVVDLIERENKVMTQYTELQEMGQYLNLPPEAREKIAQQQIQHLQQQHGLMLQAIPEWKDQAAFEKGRIQIHQLGEEYGVDLSRVTDHRVVKMLNDYATLKARIKTAKASVKQVKTSEPKAINRVQSGRQTDLQTAVSTAKKSGNVADQLKAVDMLLKG